VEIGGQHANHVERTPVERHMLADDRWVLIELRGPQRM
jgi:hypothetical protein